MELMSSLLLCALAALLPQTLGIKSNVLSEIKREPTKFIETPIAQKPIVINTLIPSTVPLNMLLKSFLQDRKCHMCVDCLTRSLNSMKIYRQPSYMRNLDGAQNDLLDSYNNYDMIRQKRAAENNVTAKVVKTEHIKVTKYDTNGQTYALKIRGKNLTISDSQVESCEVYKVKQHYPCDSPKADLLITAAKQRTAKRSKKQTKNTKTNEPQSPELQPQTSAKVLAEPFMTSIEELYN